MGVSHLAEEHVEDVVLAGQLRRLRQALVRGVAEQGLVPPRVAHHRLGQVHAVGAGELVGGRRRRAHLSDRGA